MTIFTCITIYTLIYGTVYTDCDISIYYRYGITMYTDCPIVEDEDICSELRFLGGIPVNGRMML